MEINNDHEISEELAAVKSLSIGDFGNTNNSSETSAGKNDLKRNFVDDEEDGAHDCASIHTINNQQHCNNNSSQKNNSNHRCGTNHSVVAEQQQKPPSPQNITYGCVHYKRQAKFVVSTKHH